MKFRRSISPRQESPVFDEKRFWIGISVGITWSIVMYLFLQVIRSAIFFFFGFNNLEIVVIDFSEYRFYSFIIAFFSIIFGGYQFLEFTCSKNRTFFKSGLQKKIVIFNQRNLIWTTLFVSFKFLLTAFLTLLVGTVSVWKFYSSSWWISILLSLFLYFYFWNNLKRIMTNTTKLSLIFFPVILGLAFGLSQIKPVDMEYYQEFGLRHTLHYSKQIEVPVGTGLEKIYKRSSILNFYIAELPNHPDSIQYYYGFTEMKLEDVFFIVQEFKKTKSPNSRNSIIANVIIDKDIKMKHVYSLFNRLRYSQINIIGLVGIQKDDDTRKKYFSSFQHNLKVRLPLQDNAINNLTQHIQQNPNAPKSTWEKYLNESIIPWAATPDDVELSYSSKHSIEILPNEKYRLNEVEVSKSDLSFSLKNLLKGSTDEFASFYLNVAHDATYGSYFFVRHEFKRACIQLINATF